MKFTSNNSCLSIANHADEIGKEAEGDIQTIVILRDRAKSADENDGCLLVGAGPSLGDKRMAAESLRHALSMLEGDAA